MGLPDCQNSFKIGLTVLTVTQQRRVRQTRTQTHIHVTSVWRLSVAYIVPKSRTERPRKTKIGIEVAHVTREWLRHHFLGQRSRSPGCFTHRRVGAWGGCSDGRQNVLAVGNCCYVAVCSAARGILAPTGEEESGGCISWRHAHLQLVYINSICGARHPWGETPMGWNVLPWGEVSMGEMSVGRKCP